MTVQYRAVAFTRLAVDVSSSVSRVAVEQCRAAAQRIADTLLEPVLMAIVDDAATEALESTLSTSGGKGYLLRPISTAPMGAAPLVWQDDGSPDWGAMWTSFCELALFGGPPHRGPDSALAAPGSFGAQRGGFDAVAEIQRGIRAASGLESTPAADGWLRIHCTSRKMAAWLCATIILENVDARCADDGLYVPASNDFELDDEVKSVVTVVAKCSHYYRAHVASLVADTQAELAF